MSWYRNDREHVQKIHNEMAPDDRWVVLMPIGASVIILFTVGWISIYGI
jgi:hypothetical protein